jgi:predicted AAA+ superfamily ATPase
LKYFNEEANDYHIVAAGSLLGIRLSGPKSFPVGKVNFINMYPLTFLEFLDATGRNELRKLIEHTSEINPYAAPFHTELLHLLRIYYFIGGMPEVVKHYVESGDYFEVRDIQKEIIDSYILDFAKHAPSFDIPKLSMIWDSIPHQLGKENKKFIFAALKKSARAREYENALQWLHDASLIYKVNLVNSVKIPLKGYTDNQSFKVYALDTGLLTAMAKIPPSVITSENQIFNDYKGAFVENYVLQQLISTNETELYYWKSSGIAEVDFIIEHNGKVFPLEAKSGVNPYSKSIQVYIEKYKPGYVYRTTLLNLKRDANIINIPLYAISLFPDKIDTLITSL